MTSIVINDLPQGKDLDREAMRAITGGGSHKVFTGTTYSAPSSLFSHGNRQLQAYGWDQSKWAARTGDQKS